MVNFRQFGTTENLLEIINSMEDEIMTVQYHSMKNNMLVTLTLTDEQVADFRNEWENLPFHNGFTDFEDFVICCLSYND